MAGSDSLLFRQLSACAVRTASHTREAPNVRRHVQVLLGQVEEMQGQLAAERALGRKSPKQVQRAQVGLHCPCEEVLATALAVLCHLPTRFT